MNEDLFGHDAKRALDRGLDGISASSAQRLARGRAQAIARHAWTRSSPGPVGAFRGLSVVIANGRTAIATGLLLAAVVAGGVLWYGTTDSVGEVAETDAALLGDELPPEAYLDEGFERWLKRSSL